MLNLQMKKLLLFLAILMAFSSYNVLRAQDDRKDEAIQREQLSSTVVLSIRGTTVRVQHAQPGAVMEIYTILGVKIAALRITSPDETFQLNLSKGYYILKVGSVVRKVAVR